MPTATAEEQLLLELINEARLDPMGNAKRYIYKYNALLSLNADINNAFKAFGVEGARLYDAYAALQPVGALAWSDSLATSAQQHSAAMIAGDTQSHQLPGEADLGGRAQAAGYSGYSRLGENVYAFSKSLLYGHAGLMVDWGEGPNGMQSPAGHRNNIMSAQFTEVGLDVTAENNAGTSVGPYVITEDFGARGKFFVTGVAYTDRDLNNFYSIGEGVAGLTVNWGNATATSAAAGGYSLVVPIAGAGVVTLSGGGLSGVVTVNTSVTDTNLKLDVVDGKTLLTSGSISVTGPVSTIKVITIKGTSVTAGAGDQELRGNNGADRLDGGAGDDRIFGGLENDKLFGGDGNDQLTGEYGSDEIDGGAGSDTAVFADRMASYMVLTGRDGGLVVSGVSDGTDNVRNVEYFRFSDGVYRWDATSASFVFMTNTAPTLPSSQAVVTGIGTAKQFTVAGTDPDGDPLSYTAGRPLNGTLQSHGNGVFTYTPRTGFIGLDSFTVSASDGRGGTASQTISITVAKANEAPTAAASQNVATNEGQAKQITVLASDLDGDKLTYTAAAAGHGSVTGGTNGIFTYTPTSGYSGSDSFIVTIADGKGGTVSHTVNVQIAFVVPPPSSGGGSSAPFQLYASDGQADEVGGTGNVVGTNDFQDVKLLDRDDHITFDGSFNRGGDIIRVPGNASEYAVLLSGAIVELRSGDAAYFIPIGEVGASLVFADGVRKLVYDPVGDVAKIGSQIITGTAAQVTAPTDHSPLPTGKDPAAHGSIYLADGAEFTVGGNHDVAGTLGHEVVHYGGGNLVLDGTFNQGGDKLYLPDPIGDYKAYIAGSALVLFSDAGKIFIPIGTVGMALNFDGDVHVLRYDPTSDKVFLGQYTISSVNESNPDDFLDGTVLSLDVGSPGSPLTIDLNAATQYTLTENSGVTSNVRLQGFNLGDVIKITGASVSEYNFSNGDADKDGVYGDLIITYNANNVSNSIAILDAVAPNAFVHNLSSAETAMGGQFINVASGGGSGGGGGGGNNGDDEQTLDIGSPSSPVPVNLDADTDYVLSENANVTSNVQLRGFDLGDVIEVTGAPASEYNFSNGDADRDGAYGDLVITYTHDNVINAIALIDVLSPNALVLNLSTAEAAMGGQFITFG